MAPPPASPTATILSDALDQDRRRDAPRHRTFLPVRSPSQLMLGLHRLGFACFPRSGAARTPTPTGPSSVPQPQVVNVAVPVPVPERRPLREREEAAAKRIHDHHTPAESKAEAVTHSHSEASAGDHNMQSSDHTASTVAVGRGGSIWVRVLPNSVTLVDSPHTSAESTPTAEDKYAWADKYRPNFLNDFICNKDAAIELYNQVTAHGCNHIIFEGPPAVGKRSMVSALIRDAFATHSLKIEEQTKRFELKNLVAELKRDRDEEFQNSIDQLALELNRCKDCARQKEQCISRDTGLEIRNINIEGFAMEGHDQRETIQCFIKIEEFTVRFMSFYRSLKAKNMNIGGVL